MNGNDELDEYGIPIKKKKAPEQKQEVDEFGIPIKKKEFTPSPSGSGDGGSKSKPAKINLQGYVAGTTAPTTQVDEGVAEKRQEIDQANDIPQPEYIQPTDRPVQPIYPPADLPEYKPENITPGEKGTALEYIKENPELVADVPDRPMLSEELNPIDQEIQQLTVANQLGVEPSQIGTMPGESVIPPKVKQKPDGTGTYVNNEYYQNYASPNEKLAAQGFYFNEQSDKTGKFDLFQANPDEIFQKYEPQIVEYLNTLQTLEPEKYADMKSRIEAGNFTQEDQFNVISKIEAANMATLNRDLQIATERMNAGEPGYEDYIAQKIPQLQEAEITVSSLYQQFPVLAEKQWEQDVLNKRWNELQGAEAIPLGAAMWGAKIGNMLNNTINSTGQFLLRSVGANETANGWNNWMEEGIVGTPQTPIVTTNPDGSTSINWANAITEVGPQLAQMYLVFGKGAGAIQSGATALAGGEISKNTGLFVAGYMATYKDLYDQAKAANLSDEDANIYASLVGMGVAGAELIMPDRNFFREGQEAILRHTIAEAAKGTTGKALSTSISNFVKNTFKEEAEEFTQDLVSNASAVMADGIVDGANFDAELFDKEGILNTAIVTGLTAGLAGTPGLYVDATQRNRDLFNLSRNYENFQQQLPALVQNGTITQQQADRLVKDVDAIRVAETKVPPTVPEEKKSEVVPLVAEKEKLEEEAKGIDPLFRKPYEQRIQEISEEVATLVPDATGQVEVKGEEKPAEEKLPPPPKEIVVGDDINFMQGRGQYAKERSGKVEEVLENGDYRVTFDIGGEKTFAIVKPENVIQDATQERKIEQSREPEYQGTSGLQQGQQENRPNEEGNVTEGKTEAGDSYFVTESRAVEEEVDYRYRLEGAEEIMSLTGLSEPEYKAKVAAKEPIYTLSDIDSMVEQGFLEEVCPPVAKAENGVQMDFVPGGKWEIVEEFSGPSHKEGGIDIEITGGKIQYKGEGEFVAKRGGFFSVFGDIGRFLVDASIGEFAPNVVRNKDYETKFFGNLATIKQGFDDQSPLAKATSGLRKGDPAASMTAEQISLYNKVGKVSKPITKGVETVLGTAMPVLGAGFSAANAVNKNTGYIQPPPIPESTMMAPEGMDAQPNQFNTDISYPKINGKYYGSDNFGRMVQLPEGYGGGKTTNPYTDYPKQWRRNP